MTVSDCKLYMNLKASNQNGILKLDFSKVDVIITNYEVKLDGSNDLSKAIEIVFNSFKTFFKKELVNMLAWRSAKSIEDSLN